MKVITVIFIPARVCKFGLSKGKKPSNRNAILYMVNPLHPRSNLSNHRKLLPVKPEAISVEPNKQATRMSKSYPHIQGISTS